MVDRHQRELVAKQEELDQEVEACNRMCQARLAEYEAEQKAKWQEAVSRINIFQPLRCKMKKKIF